MAILLVKRYSNSTCPQISKSAGNSQGAKLLRSHQSPKRRNQFALAQIPNPMMHEFEIMSEKGEEDEDPGISSLNSAFIKNNEESIFCHFVCDFLFF